MSIHASRPANNPLAVARGTDPDARPGGDPLADSRGTDHVARPGGDPLADARGTDTVARRSRFLGAVTLLVLCAFAVACARPAPPTGNAASEGRPAPGGTVAQDGIGATGTGAAATRNVVDDLGRSVHVVARPERIVSLAPSITEILFAIGAGPRVIATTSYCTFPPEAANTNKIGDTQKPDIERILALKPDLVLVSTASQLESISERLGALGVPVVVTAAKGVDGVLTSIERIGVATGDTDAATALTATLRARIESVRATIAGRPAPKVFAIVGNEPLFTSGKGTFLDDLIRLAGGASITADETTEWPQYSAEAVIAKAPDVILVPLVTHGFAAQDSGVPKSIAATPAVRNGRIVKIDGDLLMRPGPRLVDGLEQLAKALHPEAYR